MSSGNTNTSNFSNLRNYLGPCALVLTLTICVILLVRQCTSSAERSVRAVADGIHQVFNVHPQITIDSQVIETQTKSIAELALVQQDEQVSVRLSEHEEVLNWPILLTQKDLTAQATYRVKAGFDLSQPFHVGLNFQTGQVTALLPPAKILSVELVSQITSSDAPGWLNRITPEDRTKLLGLLDQKAHEAAEQSNITTQAQDQANARLTDLLHQGSVGNVNLMWKQL